MDTGTAIVFGGVVISFFVYLEYRFRDLRDEIKEVRLASESAHEKTNSRLTGMESTKAAHEERLKFLETQRGHYEQGAANR